MRNAESYGTHWFPLIVIKVRQVSSRRGCSVLDRQEVLCIFSTRRFYARLLRDDERAQGYEHKASKLEVCVSSSKEENVNLWMRRPEKLMDIEILVVAVTSHR
jgi:hypothetical protein